ncbi:hypothetical protein D3C73_1354320 [compost metagenome]
MPVPHQRNPTGPHTSTRSAWSNAACTVQELSGSYRSGIRPLEGPATRSTYQGYRQYCSGRHIRGQRSLSGFYPAALEAASCPRDPSRHQVRHASGLLPLPDTRSCRRLPLAPDAAPSPTDTYNSAALSAAGAAPAADRLHSVG